MSTPDRFAFAATKDQLERELARIDGPLFFLDNVLRSLWGTEPNQEAARQLGVPYLKIKRWRRGIQTVPPGVWAELGVCLTNEAARLTQLANQCAQRAKDDAA